MSKKIIINADDFGLCKGVNDAVVKAHTQGVLTSATIMTNSSSSDEAVRLSKSLVKLGVGIHLNLTEGKLTSKDAAVTYLSAANGEFAFSPGKISLLSVISSKIRQAIRIELRAQIEWLLRRDIRPTHIDSHKHVHTFPAIFKIISRLAEEYNISTIRWPMEGKLAWNHWPGVDKAGIRRSRVISMLAKINKMQNPKYFKTDGFLGIAHTGQIDVSFFQAACLHSASSVVEIMTHPGFVEGLDPGKTRLLGQREEELNALCSEQTKTYFEKAGIQLIHYGQL
jgi:chitin disaccharide deacetylase